MTLNYKSAYDLIGQICSPASIPCSQGKELDVPPHDSQQSQSKNIAQAIDHQSLQESHVATGAPSASQCTESILFL